MKLDAAQCRRLFAGCRVARLATSGRNGPHVVPIVFALDGDEIVFAVDDKPKSTRRLQRLANLERDPRAAVLADQYSEDWSQLWWVRADVTAAVSNRPDDVAHVARKLAGRYEPYLTAPPRGPVVRLRVRRWSGWSASPPDHAARSDG